MRDTTERNGRRRANRRMRESVVVVRLSDTQVDEYGASVPTETVVYEGRANLFTHSQYELHETSGAHESVRQRLVIKFPIESFKMRDGDIAIFQPGTYSPALDGQRFRLNGIVPSKTNETSYKVYADRVVA